MIRCTCIRKHTHVATLSSANSRACQRSSPIRRAEYRGSLRNLLNSHDGVGGNGRFKLHFRKHHSLHAHQLSRPLQRVSKLRLHDASVHSGRQNALNLGFLGEDVHCRVGRAATVGRQLQQGIQRGHAQTILRSQLYTGTRQDHRDMRPAMMLVPLRSGWRTAMKTGPHGLGAKFNADVSSVDY